MILNTVKIGGLIQNLYAPFILGVIQPYNRCAVNELDTWKLLFVGACPLCCWTCWCTNKICQTLIFYGFLVVLFYLPMPCWQQPARWQEWRGNPSSKQLDGILFALHSVEERKCEISILMPCKRKPWRQTQERSWWCETSWRSCWRRGCLNCTGLF